MKVKRKIKGKLVHRILKMFRTPFRHGFTLMYLLFSNNMLLFTNNIDEKQNILDFGMCKKNFW